MKTAPGSEPKMIALLAAAVLSLVFLSVVPLFLLPTGVTLLPIVYIAFIVLGLFLIAITLVSRSSKRVISPNVNQVQFFGAWLTLLAYLNYRIDQLYTLIVQMVRPK